VEQILISRDGGLWDSVGKKRKDNAMPNDTGNIKEHMHVSQNADKEKKTKWPTYPSGGMNSLQVGIKLGQAQGKSYTGETRQLKIGFNRKTVE